MFTYKKSLSNHDHHIATHKVNNRNKKIYYTYEDDPTNMSSIKQETKLSWKPDKDQVWQIAIYGASGSGKSHAALEITKAIGGDWLLISAKQSDVLFDDQKHIRRVPLYSIKDVAIYTPELTVETIGENEYNLLFDDFDSFPDERKLELNKFVRELITTCLKRGRSLGINIIIITQQGRNSVQTMAINQLCQQFVLFPSTNKSETTKFLKKIETDKKTMALIESLPKSRYQKIILNKKCPKWLWSDKGLYVID